MQGRGRAWVAGIGAAVLAGCGEETADLAVIPKTTSHEFFRTVHAGASKASQESGYSIEWIGPNREDAREQQKSMVENFISAGVRGIALAPLDDRALVSVCEDAKERGIPVVIFDSALDWDGAVSFVASDNTRGGVLAADRLGEVLEGEGRVIMLRHQEGSASTEKREQGFLDRIRAQYPDIQLLDTDQRAGATTESAQAKAESLLHRFEGQVDGIFCPNESTVHGMLRALEDRGLAGEVRFVGFDATAMLVEALRDGKIDGLVLQDPFRMGEEAVRALVAHVEGEDVPRRIDTGVHMVTADNMDEPEMHRLLSPDNDRWLDD